MHRSPAREFHSHTFGLRAVAYAALCCTAIAAASARAQVAPTPSNANTPSTANSGPAPAVQAVRAKDKFLPLEVVVNGDFGGTWVLIERNGILYAPKEAFAQWRVGLREGVEGFDHQDQKFFPLSAVPGFSAQINVQRQTLELTFAATAFSAFARPTDAYARTPPSPVLPSVYLNYDLSHTDNSVKNGAGNSQTGALTELGVSLGMGVFTSTAVSRNLFPNGAFAAPRETVRLESTYTYDFLDSGYTLRAGDSTTRAGSLGRSVYFGGIQFGSNFSLKPGFIGQPKPTVSGVSSAPSTVELYVDNVLRQTQQVPTGPFTIGNLPQLNGGAQTRVVVRDLLGRETVLQQSIFSSPSLLEEGLNDWSVEIGTLRENYSQKSNDYGDAFMSGLWRRGISDGITGEGRIELSSDIKVIGFGVIAALPADLLGRFALIGSNSRLLAGQGRNSGVQALAGLEYFGNRWSSSLQITGASEHFRQLGLDLATKPDKYQAFGNINYAMPDGQSSWGVSLASISRYDLTRVTTLSANYSHRIGERGRVNYNLSRSSNSAAGGIGGGSSSTSLGIVLTIPLEKDIQWSTGLTLRKQNSELYTSAQYNPLDDGQWGWRVQGGIQEAQSSGSGYAEAGVYYPGQYGRFSADVSVRKSQINTRLGLTGAVAVVGGGIHASQRISNSFALVEVPGYPDVPVIVGGQRRGKTNANGQLLVPRLSPYQINSIQLDADALPISAELDSIESPVVPAWRSAALAKFAVRSGRAAVITIKLDDGSDAPVGSLLKIDGDSQEFYVANRGLGYVTGLSDKVNLLTLSWKEQKCRLEVMLPPVSKDDIAKVGPVVCKGVRK